MEDKILLKQIEESLKLNSELQVTEHFLNKEENAEIFLRVLPKVLDMQYQNSIYAVVSVRKKNVTLRIFSYDTSLLINSTENSSKKKIEISSVVTDIQNRLLSEKQSLCPGYKKEDALKHILIHQFQGSIVYRSRECDRLTSNANEICEPCSAQQQHCSAFLNSSSLKVEALEPVEDYDNSFECDDYISNLKFDEDYEPPSFIKNEDSDTNEKDLKDQKDFNEEDHESNDKSEDNTKSKEKKPRRRLPPEMRKYKAKYEIDKSNYAWCPVQSCDTQFKHFLGPMMTRHLKKHGILDTKNPPEQYKKDLDEQAKKFQRPEERKKCEHPGCSYVASNPWRLKNHFQAHLTDRLFCCQECGKTYKYKWAVAKCIRKHKGILNFKCSHCDKAFTENKKLRQHILTHTKEKPFKCPFCTFKCARWDNLNKHSQNIHGMGLRMAEQLALETSKNVNLPASDDPENKVTPVSTNNTSDNNPNIMPTDQIMFQQLNMKSTFPPSILPD